MKTKAQYHFYRLLSALLTVAMLLSIVPVAQAEEMHSDLEGHWAQAVMQEFSSAGYIESSAEGRYLPDEAINRAQFAGIINRLMGYTVESTAMAQYTDVSVDDWYYHDLAKALAAGYMLGTSQTEMSPEASLTREQAMVMLVRMLDI